MNPLLLIIITLFCVNISYAQKCQLKANNLTFKGIAYNSLLSKDNKKYMEVDINLNGDLKLFSLDSKALLEQVRENSTIKTYLEIPKEYTKNLQLVVKSKCYNDYVIDIPSELYTCYEINLFVPECSTCIDSICMPDSIETAFGLNLEMVYVNGGSCIMGVVNPYNEDEPLHSEVVPSFYMGQYEITNAQWDSVMNVKTKEDPDLPKTKITWDEANEFCQKLSEITGKNYSLPTEEQWEYAAKGGIYKETFKYVGSNYLDSVAWHADNSAKSIHKVKRERKKPNSLCIYGMSGNASEWCILSRFSCLKNADKKVTRGGCFSEENYYFLPTTRILNNGKSSGGIGFRVVLNP